MQFMLTVLTVLMLVTTPQASANDSTCNSFTDCKLTVLKLTQLAEKGDIIAQEKLGMIYLQGVTGGGWTTYIDKNPEKSVYWYTKAAKQSSAEAQFKLGWIYREGLTAFVSNNKIPPNHKKALFWYTKAAEQEHADAQYHLASIYARGLKNKTITPKGLLNSFRDYRKNQETTTGRDKNNSWPLEVFEHELTYTMRYAHPQKAFYWISKAAERGNPHDQFELGIMHFHGKDFPHDYIKAYKWLNLSESNSSYENASDIVLSKLSPEQIEEAKRLANEWKPTKETSF